MINFEVKESNVAVEYASLRREFDVRKDPCRDADAVDEIVAQGKICRRPLVTTDLVIIDGRTVADAAVELEGVNGASATVIHVDMVGFSWDKLTVSQKQEVRAEALRLNSPSKSSGYRRFATDEDFSKVVEDNIREGVPKKRLFDLLSFIPEARLESIFKITYESVKQSRIKQAVRYACEKNVTPSKAVEELGLPVDLLDAVKNYGKNGRNTSRVSKTSFLNNNQGTLDTALRQLKNWGKVNLEKFKKEMWTGKMTIEVAEHHAKTAQKILTAAEAVLATTRQEVNAVMPNNHRT